MKWGYSNFLCGQQITNQIWRFVVSIRLQINAKNIKPKIFMLVGSVFDGKEKNQK